MALALVTAPLISRELGPSGRGLYATCLAALSLSPVVIGLGIPMAVRRLSSVTDMRPIIRVVYRIVILLMSPAFALGVVALIFLLPDLSNFEEHMFLAAMCSSALFVLVLCVQSSLIARSDFRSIAILHFIQPSCIAIVVVISWLSANLTLGVLLGGYIVGTVVAAFVAIIQVRVPFRGPRISMLYIGRQGARYAGSQIAETASNTVVMLFAVLAMGAFESGYLAVAMTIAVLPLAIAYAIGSAVFRGIAGALDAELQQGRNLAVRSAFIAGAGASSALALIVPIGLPLLFGSDFVPAVPTALVLIGGATFSVVNYVATQVLGAEGRGGVMTTWQVTGLVVSVCCLFALSPQFGAIGAAVGIISGWLVTCIGSLHALRVGPSIVRIRTSDIRSCMALCIKGKFDISTL